MHMKSTSGDLLEFDELKSLLGRYVAGPLGRAELDRLQPGTDREHLEATLAEVAQAIEFNREMGPLPLGGLVDSSESVAKLRIEGASLEASEIAGLTRFLERSDQVRSLLSGDQFPLLVRRSGMMADFRSLLREVGGKVLGNGTVADDASVALNRLRRDIERQQRSVHQSLERFLKTHRDEGVLQEEYITIRNDRFVVPVVAGQKRRIDGVIHGASSSGQTLFVEPLETIDLNNELVRLREEEQREVARILHEITGKLRAHAPDIRRTMQVVSELDLLFAKAAFASEFDCVIPRFSPGSERRVLLREARHPLLQDVLRRHRKRTVPASLTLDGVQRILLISGPNTGGKTVAMKTVGLLALMAHSGLPVPATEAEFPIFDQVLADIGDQQSIEQSLSTFSAHIACVKAMVEDSTPDSLVLLDELGRATDPEEGGALGVAILDHFRSLGCMVVASTHLLALKVYGANTPSVLNGSMGFDEDTLAPTYVLRVGAPGKSAGLDIATRLGMAPWIIERARQAMTTIERDIARFLAELHDRLDKSTALQRELEQRLAQVKAREADIERNYKRREAELIRKLQDRYDEVVANFEARALDTIQNIKELREQRKLQEQAKLQVARVKREGMEDLHTHVIAATETPTQYVKPKLEEGSRILLKGIRQPARVRRIISDKVIEVDAGFLKMQVDIGDVQEILPEKDPGTSKLPRNVTFQQAGPKWDMSYQEINVIGKRAEEAMEEVDHFLDQAALASVDRVRIVHGHGMGVLKKAVANLLAKSPHVDKFYPASPQEGGAGATIAELKTA
jgi:DNA mismatch repair protein MutS2